MKKLSVILLIILFSGLRVASGQTNNIPPEISLAFKAGNVEVLSKYLNSTVELVILDKEDFYKKDVAKSILKEFFKEYSTVDFTIKHQGGKNDAFYAIGNLNTRNGSFRVYFLIKKVGSESLIHQLRIEKDDTGDSQ